MQEFMLTDLNRRPGELLEVAAVEPLALTRYRRVRFVLMSAEHYRRISEQPASAGNIASGGQSRAAAKGQADPAEAPPQLPLFD